MDQIARELREWGCFFGTLLKIGIPFFIFLAGLEALAWKTGETVPLATAIRWQKEGEGRLWGVFDRNSYAVYKIAEACSQQKKILIMGSSRMQFFKAADFAPYDVYNGSNCCWSFQNYIHFLQKTERECYTPKVIIFAMDYWMFSDLWEDMQAFHSTVPYESHLAALSYVGGIFFKNPLSFLRQMEQADSRQGLLPLTSDQGFRPDGSWYVGDIEDPLQRAQRSKTPGRDPHMIVLKPKMEGKAIAAFEQFIALARGRHIALIGIQMPIWERHRQALESDSSGQGLWREFRSPERRQYFAAQGVLFFDYADLPEYRSNPSAFASDAHPYPEVYATLAHRLLADPEAHKILAQTQQTP